MKAPIARGTTRKSPPTPKIVYTPTGNCLVTHSEYVQDVTSANGTVSIVLPCNPQRSTLFTWLSAIATRFEMYRFKKLKFHYKPSCPTTTSGYVGVGFDFDAYDDVPTKMVMLAWKYSAKCAAWQSVSLDVSADSRVSTARYCYPDVAVGDKRLNDLGNFVVLIGSDAVVSVGELFVEYTVEMIQPSYRLPPVLFAGFSNNSPTGPNQWFQNLAVEVGNLAYEILGPNAIIVREVGKFLLTIIADDDSIGSVPALAITQPAGTTNSSWSNTTVYSFYSAGGTGILESTLFIDQAPVQLTLTGGDGALRFLTRIATYANSL